MCVCMYIFMNLFNYAFFFINTLSVNIDKYVTSFDILKKNMNKQEENCKTN